MKEHGILFSAPMVKSLLRPVDPKWQTRRGLNPQPPADVTPILHVFRGKGFPPGGRLAAVDGDYRWAAPCPHPPGTRLWVRETSAVGDDGRTYYRADGRPPMGGLNVQKWTPSLHMPRWAARTFLDVLKVRVERAQDISDADVAAEGMDAEAVRALAEVATMKRRAEAGLADVLVEAMRPAELWRAGWTLINGAESYRANPWVWVYEFRRAL